MEIGSQKKITFTEQQATAHGTFLQHHFRFLVRKRDVLVWFGLSVWKLRTAASKQLVSVSEWLRWDTSSIYQLPQVEPAQEMLDKPWGCWTIVSALQSYSRRAGRVKDESSLSTNSRHMEVREDSTLKTWFVNNGKKNVFGLTLLSVLSTRVTVF